MTYEKESHGRYYPTPPHPTPPTSTKHHGHLKAVVHLWGTTSGVASWIPTINILVFCFTILDKSYHNWIHCLSHYQILCIYHQWWTFRNLYSSNTNDTSKDIKSCELFKIRKKPKRYENNKISCGNTQHNSELLTQLTPIFWRGQEPSFKEIAEGVLPSSSDESGWPQLNVKYFWIITKQTAK